MSELQFAKQFLSSVDAKTTKYQPDHVFDPKTFATRVPYTLPKLSHPPHPEPPRTAPAVAAPVGSEPAEPDASSQRLTLTLKSNRNPNMTLTLKGLPLSTPVADIKTQIQTHLGGSSVVSTDKIKVILNKKPIPSSKKTLADAFADSDLEGKPTADLSVMVMGGAPDPPAGPQTVEATVGPESEKAAAEALAADAGGMEGVLPTTSGDPAAAENELAKPEFWADLEAFLTQRLKSEERASELRATFERAWLSGNAAP